MSVIFCDSFDMYNGTGANTGLNSKWVFSGGATYSMQPGRFGGQAAMISGQTGFGASIRRFTPDGAGYSTCCYKFAFKCSAVVAQGGIADLREVGGTVHLSLSLTGSGELTVTRSGGPVLATSAPLVIFGDTWQYIEWEAVIDDTSGSTVVRVDGIEVINVSGVDTRNGGTGLIAQVAHSVSSSNGTDYYYDDVIFYDDITTPGERRVEVLRPAADTATKQFTPNSGSTNYTQVDETLVDGNTTYVEAGDVGFRDLYTVGSLSSVPVDIDAVQLVGFPLKTDAGTRTLYLSCQSGAADNDGSAFPLNSNYMRVDRVLNLDPDGSIDWTATKVNALKIGPKIAS